MSTVYVQVDQRETDLRFDVPARNAGQIVEVAYADHSPKADEACIGAYAKRVTDTSCTLDDPERVTHYQRVDKVALSSVLKGLNALAGSSASGSCVVVDVLEGSVGSHLFSSGSYPRLRTTERLVLVGRKFTMTDVVNLIQTV